MLLPRGSRGLGAAPEFANKLAETAVKGNRRVAGGLARDSQAGD